MSQEEIKNPLPPPPAEDASSQALADALRSSFFIVKIIMVGLVVLFLSSGFFTVDAQHRAIILRLGKPVGEGEAALLQPGWHWSFPKPIDQIDQIPFTSLQTADSTVGWYQSLEDQARGVEPQRLQTLNPATISYVLSSDTNIVHVTGRVHYRITDPIRFHFDFADGALFVTNALNNALLFASSRFSVDDILTLKAAAFREAVDARLRDLIDQQKLGVTVEQLDVYPSPPRYLLDKFNEVVQATLKRDDARNKAETYANQTLAAARGEAQRRINAAQAERSRQVGLVAAEADKFTKLLPQYLRDPQFFVEVRQMAAVEKVLGEAQEKILQPHSNSRELRLQLSREPVAPGTNQVASP